MGRTLLVGIWACFVTLAATYGAAYWRTHARNDGSADHKEAFQVRSIKPITVPIIVDGVLKGYVSAEFTLVGARSDAHSGDIDPESFVMDEAFRLIYGDARIDFAHIQKADLATLTGQLTANVNHRMGREAVKETLVKNLVYVAREDVPR